MGVLDWLFNVEIEEEEQDELYPEENEDDPEAPERLHNEVHGFDERFGEGAQTERVMSEEPDEELQELDEEDEETEKD